MVWISFLLPVQAPALVPILGIGHHVKGYVQTVDSAQTFKFDPDRVLTLWVFLGPTTPFSHTRIIIRYDERIEYA